MFTFKDALIFGLLCVVSGFLYFTWTVLPPQMDGTSVITFRPAMHTYRLVVLSLRSTHRNLIQSGTELGSSFSVYRENENVLSVFGGYTDKRFHLAWTKDTVVQTFTLGLISVSFTFALLVQRSVLFLIPALFCSEVRSLVNLTDPLVKYIPTFSATQVTISDLLTHQVRCSYFHPKSLRLVTRILLIQCIYPFGGIITWPLSGTSLIKFRQNPQVCPHKC